MLQRTLWVIEKRSQVLGTSSHDIAKKREKLETSGNKEDIWRLNADFQGQARKKKETYFSQEHQEKENDKKGKIFIKKSKEIMGKIRV